MEKIMLVDDAAFMRMMIKNALTQKATAILWKPRMGRKREKV